MNNDNLNLKPSEILAAAKHKILNPKHWIKDQFHEIHVDINTSNPYDCYCSLGAVNVVAQGNPEFLNPENISIGMYRSAVKAKEYLNKIVFNLDEDVNGIAGFNDKLDIRHEDILAVFDLAIDEAMKDEQGKGI